MKKIISIIISIFMISTFVNAQLSEYETIMIENITQLYAANSKEQLQHSANTFERIAQKNSEKWHPLYYRAYAHIMLSMREKESLQMDKQLDIAQELIKNAIKVSSENSELYTLQGFVYMLRIPIDPANRGPQYSGMGSGAFYRAIGIDPNNPRAHMMLSDMQFGTARFMGSNDFSEACASLDKAIQLYKTTKQNSALDPSWGSNWTDEKKKQCIEAKK